MIVQDRIQIRETFTRTGSIVSSTDQTVRLPKNAIAWRMRPDAYGGTGVTAASATVQTSGPGAAGQFPANLTVDGGVYTLDNAQWQTFPARVIQILTDAYLKSAIANLTIMSGSQIVVTSNWIVEYCTEDRDLLLGAPQKYAPLPTTSTLELLVLTTGTVLAGPFQGNEAQVLVENLGPNTIDVVVFGAYGQQAPTSIPTIGDNAITVNGGGGFWSAARMGRAFMVLAVCATNQIAGAGTRVQVIDQ